MIFPITGKGEGLLLTQDGELVAKLKMIDCTVTEVIPKEDKQYNTTGYYNLILKIKEFMGNKVEDYDKR